MRKSVLLVTVISLSMVWASLLIADEEMCVPMGTVTLAPLNGEGKRADVEFPHGVHFSYSCQECHHTWTGEENVQNCTTAKCHDLEKAPKNEDGKPVKDPEVQIRYFKKAYHVMCIRCHKEIKKQNKALEASKTALGIELSATGPTGCNECHPKEYEE